MVLRAGLTRADPVSSRCKVFALLTLDTFTVVQNPRNFAHTVFRVDIICEGRHDRAVGHALQTCVITDSRFVKPQRTVAFVAGVV